MLMPRASEKSKGLKNQHLKNQEWILCIYFFKTCNSGEAVTYFYTSNCKYKDQLTGRNSC